MDGPHRSGPTPTDPGAAAPAWRPSRGYLIIAAAVVAVGLAYGLRSSPAPAPLAVESAPRATLPVVASRSASSAPVRAAAASSATAASPLRAAAPGVPAPEEAQHISRTRDPDGDSTPDLSDYVNQGEKPTMGEVIDRLHQAGIYGGLGAFSPPGTRPPLVGLAVPEDFVLPEGYVRHYQATDDGQRIEPILMFSPDHPVFDAAGRPIAIPQDRVVPPEFAPPGLPIRRIEIPAPAQPAGPGR
jgi:hypothetical protein